MIHHREGRSARRAGSVTTATHCKENPDWIPYYIDSIFWYELGNYLHLSLLWKTLTMNDFWGVWACEYQRDITAPDFQTKCISVITLQACQPEKMPGTLGRNLWGRCGTPQGRTSGHGETSGRRPSGAACPQWFFLGGHRPGSLQIGHGLEWAPSVGRTKTY